MQTEQRQKIPILQNQVVVFSKNTCQYCGSTKHLTLDHVILRSKGGTHIWDNVVAACAKCNSTKGDSPAERLRQRLHKAGMVLRTKPKAPMHPALAQLSVREAFRRKGTAFAEQFWKEQQPIKP
jgi:5-methylcytosine-specific restriction endonuclease McrA